MTTAATLLNGRVRYVVVVHTPTGRAYSLDAGYGLLEREVAPDVVEAAKAAPFSVWVGWTPGFREQRPAWHDASLADRDFCAYWTCSAGEAGRVAEARQNYLESDDAREAAAFDADVRGGR